MVSDPDANHLVHEPEHAANATALLMLHQDRHNAPRLVAFVESLAQAAQAHEDDLLDLSVGATTIDGATGVSLQRWGELLGMLQGALDAELYRTLIELQIRVNSEAPTVDAMYEVLRDAVAPSTVQAIEIPPACVWYIIDSGAELLPDDQASKAARLLASFRAAGVITPVTEIHDGAFRLEWGGGEGTPFDELRPLPRTLASGRE